LTPGNTPLPRALTIEPPLLGHRYLPISIAGDGAFSRTIIAQDVLHPQKPIVAIKAMKPGFERIGKQVRSSTPLSQEYSLLRRIQNLPMPKYTNLPIVQGFASFFESSTYHLVLEALEPEQVCLPECPHQPNCASAASCPYRQNALRKVATQLLLGLSVLHDQLGYIHADMKPENILRCRGCRSLLTGLISVSPSMKLKLIDLGNAMPLNRKNIYYDDFEVQSIHYRAPEVHPDLQS
jgi:serine/threonine protein kinase